MKQLLPLRLTPYLLMYVLLNNGINFVTTKEIPDCDFMDTVNITDGTKLDDGSYIYENITIPRSLIGVYSYDLVRGTIRVTVPAHVRGCVCKLKSCVKFCCHPSKIKLKKSWECTEGMKYSPFINVTLENGYRQSLNVLEEFVIQQGIPCYNGFILSPELAEDDDWELFENGTLLRLYDGKPLPKSEYCFTPGPVNDGYILNPINCPNVRKENISGIMLVVSILFLVLTIIVYLAIPKLRNLHGKCLICYLAALAFGYIMLVVIFFENNEDGFSKDLCIALGLIAHFCLLSAFVWMSVISFDLFYHFHVAKENCRSKKRLSFVIYSICAWGIPLLLTTLRYYNQTLDQGHPKETCFLNTKLWSPVYLFGPTLILMIFILNMFILIRWKINKIQKQAQQESTKHLRILKDNFAICLCLFIVMVVAWLLELFSLMVQMDKIWRYLFLIPDICNASHGVIIFALLVLNRKVRILIMKRFVSEE